MSILDIALLSLIFLVAQMSAAFCVVPHRTAPLDFGAARSIASIESPQQICYRPRAPGKTPQLAGRVSPVDDMDCKYRLVTCQHATSSSYEPILRHMHAEAVCQSLTNKASRAHSRRPHVNLWSVGLETRSSKIFQAYRHAGLRVQV